MPTLTPVALAVSSGTVARVGIAAPVPEFIGAPTSGTAPLATTFTNQSTGVYSALLWNFGDGGTSTSSNPTHVYAAAGTYTVTLTLTWAGGTVTRTRTAYVGVSGSGTPPPSGTFPAVPISGGLVTMDLTAGTTGTHAWSVGHAFRQGDLPAGQALSGVQCTVKSTWPDGSAKLAVLAGGCAMTSGVARTAALVIGSAPTGTALSTAQLAAVLTQPVTVDAGAFGSASFSGADWASPFQVWVSGPLMSSWVYRKPIGSDAQLVAWLVVRLWTDGSVEVLPWVENGYLTVAGPTNKAETYIFTMGGTQRFSAAIDVLHHQRTPLVSGAALSHRLAADPAVVPKHDSAYLMATELVPTYGATVAPGDALITALPATYTPMQQGSFTYDGDSMPAPGFAAPIGLLPQHDILGLVSTASTYASVVRNGYSAGRYPIYYRDEATNRPVRPLDRPGVCVPPDRGIYAASGAYAGGTNTPAVTGGNGPVWDTAHCPSVGFMAYLLTGCFFHLETAQFATAINYLGRANLAVQRGTAGQGFLIVDPGSVGVRDCAWAWRTLAQALTATPDGDSWRAAWLTVAQNNIDHYHARYVAQANNPLGYTQAGTPDYGTGDYGNVAPWMADFLTAAWGYSILQGLPLAAGYQAKLEAFFTFTAKSITHRLATSGWHWQNPAVYFASISSSLFPDWTTGAGPWRTAAEAYVATEPQMAWTFVSSAGNTLGDENLPGSPPAAMRSFLGNLLPAISYAVRLGAAGALDGYYRLTGADNWATLAAAQNAYPGWAVRPASGLYPAWRDTLPVNQWLALAGTAGAAGSDVDAFSGWGFRPETSEIYVLAAGGHTNSGNNQVSRLRLLLDAPAWDVRKASDWDGEDINVSHYSPSGSPAARHNYHTTQWAPSIGRFLLVGAPYVKGGAGVNFPTVDGYSPAANAWDAAGTYTDVLPVGVPGSAYGFGVCQDSAGRIWTSHDRRYAPATNTWDYPSVTGRIAGNFPRSYSAARDEVFCLQWGDGTGGSGMTAFRRNMATLTDTAITFSSGSAAAVAQFAADSPVYAGMDWDPNNGRWLFWAGGSRVYAITPNSGTEWDMAILTITGTPPGAAPAGGVNSKWTYVPALKCFVGMASSAGDVFALRVA